MIIPLLNYTKRFLTSQLNWKEKTRLFIVYVFRTKIKLIQTTSNRSSAYNAQHIVCSSEKLSSFVRVQHESVFHIRKHKKKRRGGGGGKAQNKKTMQSY